MGEGSLSALQKIRSFQQLTDGLLAVCIPFRSYLSIWVGEFLLSCSYAFNALCSGICSHLPLLHLNEWHYLVLAVFVLALSD